MSDDNLESLDNASLRKKCLEYGLPNVPITDTSRKILIRRLRATISGEPLDKKKSRRETIHSTKIPSPVEPVAVQEEEPPKRINRRTIAVTSVTSTVDDTKLPVPVAKVAAVIDRRRSVQTQSSQEVPVPIKVSPNVKNLVVLDENDDTEEDDEDDVLIVESSDRNRDRRSVSLSKTGVVTTSYSQEKVVTPTTVSSEPVIARQLPPQNYDPIYELPHQKTVVPDRTSSYRTSTTNRMSIEPEPPYVPKLPPRYSSRDFGYNTSASATTTTNRRFTAGGYGSSIDAPSKYTSTFVEDKDSDDESETPYLSEFARKLERLKSEPLVKGVESPRTIPIKRESQRYHSSIVGRRSTTQDSVADSFVNFLVALDRKYKLKRNFAILLVVLAVLFVYIVVIH